jgi:two-component system chemotaxis response regulator CheY
MAKILIVDDSKTSRRFLRNMLEEAGHQIVGEAVNGQEGIDKYKQLKPDLVTMDITMPVLDGIEAVGEIMEYDADAKVIMVTAAGQKTNMVEALKRGAADFIQKPFESEVILKVVEKVLEE